MGILTSNFLLIRYENKFMNIFVVYVLEFKDIYFDTLNRLLLNHCNFRSFAEF
jgi:hypothetical protein